MKNWYYASQNERRGPVAADDILTLLDGQTIDRSTLVWREGLDQWMPLASVHDELLGQGQPRASVAAAPPPIAGASPARGVECGALFPHLEIVELDGKCVCAACKPIFLQKLREGVPVGRGVGVWRRQRELVVAHDAPLPDRCMKCNSEVQGQRLKRQLYWHHPALYIMILFPGLLIYALVAMLVRKRATLHIGICDLHRSQRTRTIIIAWSLFLAGAVAIVFGASELTGEPAVIAVTGGIVVILGGIIWGMVGARMVSARRIDKTHSFVRGACPAYLDELPEWIEN